jgi:hypothetical protein
MVAVYLNVIILENEFGMCGFLLDMLILLCICALSHGHHHNGGVGPHYTCGVWSLYTCGVWSLYTDSETNLDLGVAVASR